MSATGLDVFDKTLHTTHSWLDEIMESIGPDRHVAWKALSVVLRKLRDRVPIQLCAHLGAELPLLVRGAYYDQFEPQRQPSDWDLDAFLHEISDGLSDTRPVDAREAARAVFMVLSSHLPRGQIDKVQDALPAELREFWHAAEERVIPPPEGSRAHGRTEGTGAPAHR